MKTLANAARIIALISLVGGVSISMSSAKLQVEVKKTARGPMLFVNGKATAPTIFFVNFEVDSKYQQARLDEIAKAAQQGVNLLSVTALMPWKQDGVETSFAHADAVIDAVLTANPNALIIPRFGTSWPSQLWFEKHPGEAMLYDDGKVQTTSIHSRIWRADAAENVTALVRHLEQKYGDHMLAYHPTGQHTGEWFFDRAWEGRLAGFEPCARDAFRAYLKNKYKTDAGLRKAWHDPDAVLDSVEVPTFREQTHCTAGAFRDPMVEQKVIDFFEFQNIEMATAVENLCKAVKAGAPDKPSVAFYGYHYELAALPYGAQAGGHNAMSYILQSPYVDIIASPVAYIDRQSGGAGLFMTTVDSVQAHGKIWLVEDDTRTYLTEPDAGYGRCKDFAETSGVLARNFAHVVTHGTAVWWMDLGGSGWFNGDDLWTLLSGLQNDYTNALDHLKPYHAEIAVILDERSCLYMEPSSKLSQPLIHGFRKQWYRIGAPTGIYSLDDLVAGKVPPAKMYIMLNSFYLDQNQINTIRKNACRKGCTVVWMYAPGIVQNGKIDYDNIQDMCGISLTQRSSMGEHIVLEGASEKIITGYEKLSPRFAVSDKDARTLAKYADSDDVAIASKKTDGYTSVYSGGLQVPSSLLRKLARESGVHIYSDSDDVITAGNGFVGIHASSDGRKTLNMPSECELVDAITGASLGKAKSFEFDMKLGDTRLLRVVR